MNGNYPIKPKHVDTSREPKGFDSFLDYNQRIILWAMMQCWQYKGNWDAFTHEEFLSFIDNPVAGANEAVRLPIIRFVETRLKSLLRIEKIRRDGKPTNSYAPTHFLISTYFHWNPAH